MRRIAVRLVSLLALCASMAAQGASTITYYHNDLLGSPVVATNASGQVVWRESYRPFGERLTNSAASAKNDVWFTSRRQDADTGLVYMGARFYDPVLGRFVSKDPAGFVDSNVHSFNRYAYANNNPYRYLDPDGRLTVNVWDYQGSTEAWGHASITLENGQHISWWPSDDRTSKLSDQIPLYSAPPNRNQTYSDDVRMEGGPPDRTIRILGLDEAAIQNWWRQYSAPDSGNQWETLGPNCSTVSADALKAGGAERFSSWWRSHNSVWTPNSVEGFADSINSGLERTRETKE